jgi:hypothetical protein
VLKMIKQEYVEEDRDPTTQDELFEVKNELGELIFESLMDEMEQELCLFHEAGLEVSKGEAFLETN